MRKLLSLIALFCVMAIGAGVSVSSANAATLTSAVQSLKAQQTGVAEKAYYRRGIYQPRLLSSPLLSSVVTAIIVAMAAIIIAVAGGIMAIATAVAGTRTSAIDHPLISVGLDPGAFNISRVCSMKFQIHSDLLNRGFYDRSGLCGYLLPFCPMPFSLRKQLGSRIQTFNFRTPMEKTSRLPIGGGK